MEVHLPADYLEDVDVEVVKQMFNQIIRQGLYEELGIDKEEVRVDDFEFEDN